MNYRFVANFAVTKDPDTELDKYYFYTGDFDGFTGDLPTNMATTIPDDEDILDRMHIAITPYYAPMEESYRDKASPGDVVVIYGFPNEGDSEQEYREILIGNGDVPEDAEFLSNAILIASFNNLIGVVSSFEYIEYEEDEDE